MNLKDIFAVCINLCDLKLQDNPDIKFKRNGQIHTYTELKEELEKVSQWCYPLETQDLKLCIRCKNCKYYHKFKRCRNDKNTKYGHPSYYMLCSLDKKPKDPNFFCGSAEERKD